MCATPGKEIRQGFAGERGQGGAGIPEHLCSGSHSAAIWPSQSRPLQGPPPTPTSLCQWRADLRCPRCAQPPNSAACECRWSLTWLPRARCNAGAANASATRSATAATHIGASLVEAPTSPVGALPRGTSLRAVAAEETTQRATVSVLGGRRQRRLLLSKRPSAAGRAFRQPYLPLLKPSGPVLLPSRRT